MLRASAESVVVRCVMRQRRIFRLFFLARSRHCSCVRKPSSGVQVVSDKMIFALKSVVAAVTHRSANTAGTELFLHGNKEAIKAAVFRMLLGAAHDMCLWLPPNAASPPDVKGWRC